MKKTFDWDNKKFLSMHMIAVGVFLILFLLVYSFNSSSDIGVVDMNKVYSNAQVFKSIRTEQQTLENEWKEQALAQKKKLEEADIALSKKKGKMKKNQFDKAVSDLKEKILDFQNQQMAKLDLIRYRTSQITLKVEETMKPMIEQVAKEKKLKFVLSASNVLYHARAIDVTDDVIEQLDEAFQNGQLPSLQVSFSEGE